LRVEQTDVRDESAFGPEMRSEFRAVLKSEAENAMDPFIPASRKRGEF